MIAAVLQRSTIRHNNQVWLSQVHRVSRRRRRFRQLADEWLPTPAVLHSIIPDIPT